METGGAYDLPGSPAIPGVAPLDDPRVADWYAEEMAGFPDAPSSADLHDELDKLRRKGGWLPIGAKLARVALGGAAGFVLWEAGSFVLGKLFSPAKDAAGPPLLIDGWRLYTDGDSVPCVPATTGGCPAGGSGSPVWTAQSATRVYVNGSSRADFSYCTSGSSAVARVGAIPPGAAVVNTYQDTPSTCNGGASPHQHFVVIDPIGVGEFAPPGAPTGPGGSQLSSQSATPCTTNWTCPTSTGAAEAALDAELEAGDYPAVEELVASSVADVPDCDGLLYSECADLVTELELVPERANLSWDTAHLDKPPDAVVSTNPDAGEELDVGSTVVITTNPNEANYPLVQPALLPGESGNAYKQRLLDAGFPEEAILLKTLSELNSDPSYGPNAVVQVVPNANDDVRHDPQTLAEPEIIVEQNNPGMPEVAGGGWVAPPISGIDLGPLTEIEIGCNKFPFGVFCWLNGALGGWEGPPDGCDIDATVPIGRSADIDPNEGGELPFDVCQFEPAMQIVRPVLVILATLCLGYMFAAAAMGIGSTQNDD